METFWDWLWLMIVAFVFVAWIVLMVRIFVDVFRAATSGWAKAGWTLLLIFLPFLGALIYLIAEGKNMAHRDVADALAVEKAQRDYIREVAGSGGGTADDLTKLAGLKDQGHITEEEFNTYKAKLLA